MLSVDPKKTKGRRKPAFVTSDSNPPARQIPFEKNLHGKNAIVIKKKTMKKRESPLLATITFLLGKVPVH